MPKRSIAWLGLALVSGSLLVLRTADDGPSDGTAAPAWTARCFSRPVQMSSSDLAYIGLPWRLADQLAAERGQTLYTFGEGGHCLRIAGVAVAHPVAIAFDTGSNSGIPATARIVFASADGGDALQAG